MKAYLIDATKRTIEQFEYATGEYFREHLPGGICIAWVYQSGDVLYVDDEGLLKPAACAFRIRSRPDGQPMMSNAVLTGRDDMEATLDPQWPLDLFRAEIEWLSVDQAMEWFEARAREPAVSQTMGDKRRVIATWGDLLTNLRGGDGYQPIASLGRGFGGADQ